MKLTDQHSNIAWAGQYKAWGEVREARSDWAKQIGMSNPIRFQGQYHDHETGLHYNRYRYYDPRAGRFLSQDPISYTGGFNLFVYAPNPVEWIDPLGLWKGQPRQANGQFGAGKDPSKPCPCKQHSVVKLHGSNLNSDAPAIGYTLRDQALRDGPSRLHKQPDLSQRKYDFDQDPLCQTTMPPQVFDAIAWYHCDHLGRPAALKSVSTP